MDRNSEKNKSTRGKNRKLLLLILFVICYLFIFPTTAEAGEDYNTREIISGNEVSRQNEEAENNTQEIMTQQLNDVINLMIDSLEESSSGEEPPEIILLENEDITLTEGSADVEGAKAAIRTALNHREESVELSDYHVTTEEAWTLVEEVAQESPGHRFLVRGDTAWISFGYCIKLEIIYDLTREEQQEYEAKLNGIYNEVCNDSMTDLEKAMVLHDWIVYETQYQYGYENQYQLLFEQHGICQAYTQTYCVLLDIAGIKNTTCESSDMSHVWNNIYLDGNWYQVDCTWDDPTSHADEGVDRFGSVEHSHFLRSDDAFTEMGYNNYSNEEGITCTSTTYDEAWWLTVGSRIYIIDGAMYYLVDETTDGVRTHSLIKRNGNEVTYLLDVSNKWNVWGETSFYRNCAILGYDGTYLYYTSPTEVFRIKPGETSPETFYTYTEGNGWIYGMYVSEKYMRLQISQTYDVYGGDLIEIPLKGDVTVNNITGGTEGICDTDSVLTLSVNSVVAEGKEASYQWYVISEGKEYKIEGAVSSVYEVDWKAIKDLGITHGVISFQCVVTVGESEDKASVSVQCDLRSLDDTNDDADNDDSNKDSEQDGSNNESGDKSADAYHYVVVKQKFDVSKFYENINVSKYVITSLDTGKATITKKGLLTGKKAGKLMVTPYEKVGKKYVPIEGAEPIYIEILAPYFIPEKMYSTYLGEQISVWELVTGYEGKQKLNMYYYETKKPVVDHIQGKGSYSAGYGSIRYIAVFTNEQGYETEIVKALKVVKLKLSVKPEITLKAGKTKSISILNVPKSRTITWVSSDESVVQCIPDAKKPYKSKVIALQPGSATLSAVVDGQYYKTTITVPEF